MSECFDRAEFGLRFILFVVVNQYLGWLDSLEWLFVRGMFLVSIKAVFKDENEDL